MIGIISLLLVAIVPAVNSLSKSSGRKAAIGNLLGVIEQARGQAVKDGQPTYVVFPAQPIGGGGTISDPNILARYFYHSVAIFEDDPTNPGTPKQITAWKILPTGISLRSAISFSPWTSNKFAFTPSGAGATASFPFIKFNPNGEVESPTFAPTVPVSLGVFEGFVNGTYEKPTNSNNFTETINIARLTGRAEYTP